MEFKNGPTKEPTVTVPKTARPDDDAAGHPHRGQRARRSQKGQTITAQYHGVLWKDGSVFDSSWQRGAAADFPIGVGGVIPGWDKTLVGKKVGSRVLLVIPPADGYGKAGSRAEDLRHRHARLRRRHPRRLLSSTPAPATRIAT